MKRSGSRNLGSVLKRRQTTLFLTWTFCTGLALGAAMLPEEHRATAELRVEPGTLAAGVSLVVPPIEGRLDALVRGVLQEGGNPPGAQILATRRSEGRFVQVVALGEDEGEANQAALRLAQLLVAADLRERHETTQRALESALAESAQATEAERANRAAIDLLRPQGLTSGAAVTSRTLAAVVVESEGKVREAQAALADQEGEVLALETEVRLKRDQLVDESAAARKLLEKGGAVRPAADGGSPLAKLPGWTAWRAAVAKLEAAQQKSSATRTRLARQQLELERLRSDVERWPERSQVLARLEDSEPGLKRAADDARLRAERASRALDVELGKEAGSTPEHLVLAGPGLALAPSEVPARPWQIRLLAGLVLAIPAAVLAALVRDWQDRSLYEPETWRLALGAPVLGRVPDLSELSAVRR